VTQAITSDDTSRNGLLAVAAAGILTGVLTPLLPYLIDKIAGTPGDFRIALVAIPFAVLVLTLVRRFSTNPWWAALTAAVVTMIAFVCAVNAAIWIDGQVGDVAKAVRNIFAGLAGGLTGAAIMALGICLLPWRAPAYFPPTPNCPTPRSSRRSFSYRSDRSWPSTASICRCLLLRDGCR
jgi:hypothetical protein